jgi:hypothetical protein
MVVNMSFPSFNLDVFGSLMSSIRSGKSEEEAEAPTLLGTVESSHVRLAIQTKRLLASGAGHFIPNTTVLDGTTYLQALSDGRGVVVLGNAAGKPVAAIERVDSNTFQILSTQVQTPIAQVTRDGKVLNVLMEGEADPTYTIHKVVHYSTKKFPTKHYIKRQGKVVASTRVAAQGNSYILTVNAGQDSCFMTCLSVIADEIHI